MMEREKVNQNEPDIHPLENRGPEPRTTASRSRRRRANRLAAPARHGQLLTVEDAAEYLGIAPGTLRNWLSARRVSYVKVGRLTRLSQRDLDAFIAAHTVDAANADFGVA